MKPFRLIFKLLNKESRQQQQTHKEMIFHSYSHSNILKSYFIFITKNLFILFFYGQQPLAQAKTVRGFDHVTSQSQFKDYAEQEQPVFDASTERQQKHQQLPIKWIIRT